MADEKKPPGFVISNAVRAQRQSADTPDRSRLGEILVKSPQWKKNLLQGVDARGPGEPRFDAADPRKLKESLLELIERYWPDLVDAANSGSWGDQQQVACAGPAEIAGTDNAAAPQQAKTPAIQDEEKQRLRERVADLEAENAILGKQYADEVSARRRELRDLQIAFEQFQQESDALLSELEQQDDVLRTHEAS